MKNDLIRRQDVLHELDGCDYELKDWQRWKLKTMVRDIPSAQKVQLSGEDATSDLISKKEATTIPVMPKEHREYQTMNLDDAYEQGWFDCKKCIEELPSVEPTIIRCRDCKHHDGIRCFRWNSTIITGFNDFCSNAEKRGEEDE